MDLIPFLQWPGMALGLAGAPLVSSAQARWRQLGFALWTLSNVCWIAWSFNAETWGLLAMQAVFGVTSVMGWLNNRAPRRAPAAPPKELAAAAPHIAAEPSEEGMSEPSLELRVAQEAAVIKYRSWAREQVWQCNKLIESLFHTSPYDRPIVKLSELQIRVREVVKLSESQIQGRVREAMVIHLLPIDLTQLDADGQADYKRVYARGLNLQGDGIEVDELLMDAAHVVKRPVSDFLHAPCDPVRREPASAFRDLPEVDDTDNHLVRAMGPSAQFGMRRGAEIRRDRVTADIGDRPVEMPMRSRAPFCRMLTESTGEHMLNEGEER